MKKRFAATLNKQVSIQSKSMTGKGVDRTETWVEFCTCQASIRPISASERIKSNREEMIVSHRIKIRYRSGITNGMRMVYHGRVFDIASVINIDEKNREIEILATETAA